MTPPTRCKIKWLPLHASSKNVTHALFFYSLSPSTHSLQKEMVTILCIRFQIVDPSVVKTLTHLYLISSMSQPTVQLLWCSWPCHPPFLSCNYSFPHNQMSIQSQRCIRPCKTTSPICHVKLSAWKLDVVTYLIRWCMKTCYL